MGGCFPALARLALVLLASATLGASRSPAITRAFDDEPPGRPPSGFTFRVARDTGPARWLVQRESTNGFLAHIGEPEAPRGFALAILDVQPRRSADGASRGVVSVSARTRLASRKGSLGIVWRVQDATNYYLARLDLEHQDIGLYRVVHGNRTRIDGEDDLELDTSAWHSLKVVHEEESIRVYLGGIRVLRARDRTFSEPGAAGVWCTGDAVAHFDDLRVDTGEGDARTRRGR
jgi:hypothetical protein